jgi:hypothetical protein
MTDSRWTRCSTRLSVFLCDGESILFFARKTGGYRQKWKFCVIMLWHDRWKPEYWTEKKRQLLGNGSVNIYPRQRIRAQQWKTFCSRYFLCRTCPGYLARIIRKSRPTVKYGHMSRRIGDGEGQQQFNSQSVLSSELEVGVSGWESLVALLDGVTKQRLVKT